MFSKLFAASALLGLMAALPVQSTAVEVVAGGPDGLIQYNPSFVTANPGDVITFVFKQKNHTVTQSTLEKPCSPLPGGFDTGFMFVPENKEPFPRVQYTVKDTNPVWFYCQQTGHCQQGMVFAINPGEKLVEFQENARKTPLTPTPDPKPAQIDVVAGGPGGLIQYDPSFVTAKPGDVITFVFKQKNHTVTQSTLETPCSPLPGGFDTGFMFVPEDKEPFPRVQYTVKDTNPVWFYCQQTGHCQQEMVFAINPGEKLAKFQENARNTPLTPPSPPPPSPDCPPQDHKIIVGGATLTFQPANITAKPGDTITFEFQQKNHSVTQSSFDAPCQKLALSSGGKQIGFDSGFMPVSPDATTFPTFTIQVIDTAPIWVYCRQTGHCGQGMVFAANADECSPQSFEAFQALAIKLNGTSTSSACPSPTSAKYGRRAPRGVGFGDANL